MRSAKVKKSLIFRTSGEQVLEIPLFLQLKGDCENNLGNR